VCSSDLFLAKNINKKFIKSITDTIDEYMPTWIPGLSIKKDKLKEKEPE
jgi:hypothetical protein